MRVLSVAVVTACTIALSQIASAADLPRKAPAYTSPPPVGTWTGCYIGLNAGGVWGRMKDDWTPNSLYDPPNAADLRAEGSATLNGSGFTGGGQLGCSWQMNAFVLGAEADIQYTGLDKSRDAIFPPAGIRDHKQYHENFHSKWLATFRGRLGWLVNPSVLIYGTGGLAVANVGVTDAEALVEVPENSITSGSKTRTGWTAGGGLEWMFAPQWSLKVEYLYVDLGSFHTTSLLNVDPTFQIVHNHHLTEQIARLGVNYKFY
jgi:outer membrane immunogenic protein